MITQLLLFVMLHASVAAVDVRRHNRCIAFASPAIPPPPPISMPVWSLSSPVKTPVESLAEPDINTSMNIVTFAVPVSVEAPKLWAVSLYYNTLTHDCMIESGVGVLQLLKPAQKNLVPILGKRSGYEKDFSKRSECEKLGYGWLKGGKREDEKETRNQSLFLTPDNSELSSLDLLPNCASYVRLKLLSTTGAGDHELALCQVEDTGVWNEETQQVVVAAGPPASLDHVTALYTGQLREEGII